MKVLHTLIILLLIVTSLSPSFSQTDEEQFKSLYTYSLTKGEAYHWLGHLSNQIGPRLSGSENAAEAVEYTKKVLDSLGLDSVWLQPVMVPRWTRGEKEEAFIEEPAGNKIEVQVCALGSSVSTPEEGLKAQVIEVKSLDELEELGKEAIQGKIVFFNRPMQPDLIQTMQAYGGCVDQRSYGAAEAAKFGAVGVIVRSMNLRLDDFPHTGNMSYRDLPDSMHIPAAAISTRGAERLSRALDENSRTRFYFKQNCRTYPDVQSYNVIGEIRGSAFPEEIMTVGGHLDSWDLGDGAQDDGAGCVQSMEVLRLLLKTGYHPKRTLRVVLFMNEENGLRGGEKYAEEAEVRGEQHVFALESDHGGFSPRGFTFECTDPELEKIREWKPLFVPYLVHYFEKGFSGADIRELKNGEMVKAGLMPDTQRYFDHHHSDYDRFDLVNKRELEMGTASMAALVYLVDKYGFE